MTAMNGPGLPRRRWGVRLTIALALAGIAGCAGPGWPPRSAAELDSGIGGTGVVADGERGIGGTGIVGTVTAFGSIVVNDRTVVVPETARVDLAGRPATAADLRVGHLVELEAETVPSGLEARRVSVRQVLVGPVEQVDADGDRVRALQQSIRIGDTTVVVDASGPRIGRLGFLEAGDWIAVSGLRSPDGAIAASRVEVIPAQDEIILVGRVDQVSPNRFSVSGQPITGATSAAAAGRTVRVRARAMPTSLVVVEVAPVSASPFDGRVDRLSIQAFPGAETGYGRLPSGTPGDGEIDDTILVDGSLDDRGRLTIETVSPFRGPGRDDDNDREDRESPALRGAGSRAWDQPPEGWAGDDTDDAEGAEPFDPDDDGDGNGDDHGDDDRDADDDPEDDDDRDETDDDGNDREDDTTDDDSEDDDSGDGDDDDDREDDDED